MAKVAKFKQRPDGRFTAPDGKVCDHTKDFAMGETWEHQSEVGELRVMEICDRQQLEGGGVAVISRDANPPVKGGAQP